MATSRSSLDRFMERVAGEDLDCWQWLGGKTGTKSTYGYFAPGRASGHKGMTLAHRWIYQELVGPIPSGYELDHACGNPLCVNPQHLEPVTPAENQRRRRLVVCRSGRHDLTNPENVMWDSRGRRRGCKRCNGRNPLPKGGD